jgi:DNA-binding NarL/FixJ family response regulator
MADYFHPRVLVVDDDELLRSALCEMLANHGFPVVGATGSGQEAMELAVLVQPDVVIMDFRMAGMNGVEAIDRIRSANPSIQALLFTAYDDQALDIDAARVGVSSRIVKGSDPAQIVEALRRIARGLGPVAGATSRVTSARPPPPSR